MTHTCAQSLENLTICSVSPRDHIAHPESTAFPRGSQSRRPGARVRRGLPMMLLCRSGYWPVMANSKSDDYDYSWSECRQNEGRHRSLSLNRETTQLEHSAAEPMDEARSISKESA